MTDIAQPPVDAKKTPPPVKIPQKHPLYFYLLLIIVPLLLLVSFTPLKNLLSPKASNNIKLSFDPEKIALNANQQSIVKIMADSGSKEVAFIRLALIFDPKTVNLKDKIVPNPLLNTVIDSTPVDEANASGKALLVIAASPESKRPSGKFEIAALTLTGKTAGKSALTFDASDMQIASGDALEMEFRSTPAKITVSL